MADPMQQARELLAAEWRKLNANAPADELVAGCELPPLIAASVAAIAAALRAAPEGYVLVPVERGQLYVCPTCHGPGVVTKAVHDATRAARPQGVNP